MEQSSASRCDLDNELRTILESEMTFGCALHRRIAIDRYLYQCSFREIAKREGLTPAAVRTILQGPVRGAIGQWLRRNGYERLRGVS